MFIGHYDILGFEIKTLEASNAFLTSQPPSDEVYEFEGGSYTRCCWGNGIEVWLVKSSYPRLRDNLHFSGNTRYDFGLIECVPSTAFRTDGVLLGRGNFREGNNDGGGTFVAVQPPNFLWLQARLVPQTRLWIQITAFAHRLEWFPDRESYDTAAVLSLSSELPWASQSWVPYGTHYGAEGERMYPDASVSFTGIVLASRIVTNPATLRRFIHLEVEPFGGRIDVIANPSMVEGDIPVGAIVRCSAMLSAYVPLPIDTPPLTPGDVIEPDKQH